VLVSIKFDIFHRFVEKIPNRMPPEQAAPLLCAGLKQSELRGGILGLGGVGHMGVKIAKAMGHHITVISSSDKKREEALEHLGADEYLVSSDGEGMQKAADSLDYISSILCLWFILLSFTFLY